MPKRYFSEEILKEWISQGYTYVLFTDRPESLDISVRPIKDHRDLMGIIFYESHILPVDECNEATIRGIPFIDGSLKLVVDEH